MTIRELAYELYKEDWKISHNITREKEQREMVRLFSELEETGGKTESFKAEYDYFIEEGGYGGELYACYAEFLSAEYQERVYMKHLINDDALYKKYLTDVEEL